MSKQVLILVSVLFVSCAAQRNQSGRQSPQTPARDMEGPALFCTERELPQNLICNLERIFSYQPFVNQGKLKLSFLQFRFLPKGSSCNVSYVSDPVRPNVSFIYEGSNCYPIDFPLKDLRISRLSSVSVQFQREAGYQCEFTYTLDRSNSGIVFQDRADGRLVKYRFVNMICSDTIVTGVLDGSSAPDCRVDKKTCRPVK